jgi:hypothetical protein
VRHDRPDRRRLLVVILQLAKRLGPEKVRRILERLQEPPEDGPDTRPEADDSDDA